MLVPLCRLHLYSWLCVVWARILFEVLLVWWERKDLLVPIEAVLRQWIPLFPSLFPLVLSLHFLSKTRGSSRAAGAEELILTQSVLIGQASEYFFVQRAGDCSTEDILNTRAAIQGPGAAKDIYIWVPTPQIRHCDAPAQKIPSHRIILLANPVYLGFWGWLSCQDFAWQLHYRWKGL